MCECMTKTFNGDYYKACKDRSKKKSQSEAAQDENAYAEEEGEDEFEQDADREFKKKPAHPSNESKNCCVICCKAVFCCKTRNTVNNKEIEMSELRSR